LEKQLGTRLFEPSWWLRHHARRKSIERLDRWTSKHRSLDQWTVIYAPWHDSSTTTDSLLLVLLTPHFIAFQTAYPEIELETIVSNQILI